MNALDLLIADHNRLRGLFARFNDAKADSDRRLMSELADTIIAELSVHTSLEEEIFYPVVHDLGDELAEVVDEGLQEHHVVDVLIEELGQGEVSSAEWIAKMTVLIENVKHHADEEEADMFPPVRHRLDAEVLRDMGDQFERRKGELGAPALADKLKLTKEELLDLAKAQKIPGRSAMTQQELAATVAV